MQVRFTARFIYLYTHARINTVMYWCIGIHQCFDVLMHVCAEDECLTLSMLCGSIPRIDVLEPWSEPVVATFWRPQVIYLEVNFAIKKKSLFTFTKEMTDSMKQRLLIAGHEKYCMEQRLLIVSYCRSDGVIQNSIDMLWCRHTFCIYRVRYGAHTCICL